MIDGKDLLAQRYKIEGKLGENAVGKTYEALDTAKNTKVAIKEIVTAQAASVYKALQKYAPIDGIVSVWEVFEEDNATYAVMEFVEGVTIEDYLVKSGGKFNVDRIKNLLSPVLSSLIKLQSEGISHGNISADNFVFTNEGKLKLIGFGHIPGMISDKGKAYAPLEFYNEIDNGSNEAADVYSIAAFVYRCITGNIPQEAPARTDGDKCGKPSELGVEIDKNSEVALLMGMNVEANKRMQKIAAFYRAFYNAPAPQVELRPNPSLKEVSSAMPDMPDIQQMETAESGTKDKPGKKGSKLLIVIFIIGVIIAIVLGAIAIKLAIDYVGEGNLTSSDEFNKKTGDDAKDSNNGNNDMDTDAQEGKSIDDLMAEGHYEEAIQAILDAETDADEGAQNIQKAIDELYSQCINETNALAKEGNFDTAFAIIDDRVQYFADIAAKTGYVDNTHENDLSEQRNNLVLSCIEYMSNRAQGCANNADENGMLEALDILAQYISEEELGQKKAECYTNLVLVTMTNMSSSNESAADIRQYIDNNLSKTGNSCRLIEFWDYYDDIYHKGLGRDRMRVTSIRVSASGYILPESNVRLLTYSDINNLTQYEVYFALYEIYARHNRIFGDSQLSAHFRKYAWYNADVSPENFDEGVLSDIEKENVSTILQYQRDMGYR